MKNLRKFFFLFSVVFVFVLSKFQMGGSKIYYSNSNSAGTTDISVAAKFNELKDCYTIQINSKEDWNIETIN